MVGPRSAPFRRAPSPRRAVHSSPEPKSWTKPKTTSSIVSPCATAIEREKKGMPRFAFSDPSIGSTTSSGSAPPPTRPTSSETIAPADSRMRSRMTSSAAWSTAVVSSPPSPCPTTGSRSARVGIRASTASTSPTAALQSSSHSVKREHEQAGGELGIEERALLRHHVAAARDGPHVVDPRRAQEEGRLRLATVDRRDRLLAARRVRDAVRPGPFHDLRIQPVAAEQLVLAGAVENRPRQVVAPLVRLGPERRHETLAPTGDAVRANVLLREPPARGLFVLHEDAALAPLREARGSVLLGVGEGQVDDVVRALSAELFPFLRPDDVVRGRDERVERACDSRVVAERAERPYDCHGTDRTNRAASVPPRRLVRATTGDPSDHARRPRWSNSKTVAMRSPSPTRVTRRRTRPLQRRRRLSSRLRSGVSRRRRSTTSSLSDGTTAITADVGRHRTRRRPARTSSSDGSCGSSSARTRSTVPRPPPASVKPT